MATYGMYGLFKIYFVLSMLPANPSAIIITDPLQVGNYFTDMLELITLKPVIKIVL